MGWLDLGKYRQYLFGCMYSLEIIIHFYGLVGGFSEILKVLPSQCSSRQVFLGYMYALLNFRHPKKICCYIVPHKTFFDFFEIFTKMTLFDKNRGVQKYVKNPPRWKLSPLPVNYFVCRPPA